MSNRKLSLLCDLIIADLNARLLSSARVRLHHFELPLYEGCKGFESAGQRQLEDITQPVWQYRLFCR